MNTLGPRSSGTHSYSSRRLLNQLPPSTIQDLPASLGQAPEYPRAQRYPEETPTTDKDPILTLEASSRTLIDCTVADNVSSTPLYSVKTVGASTKVTRNSSTGGTMQFATIRWPKVLPTRIKGKEVSDGVEIQMGNHRYLGGGSLLKYGPKPNSTRKFQIPNYSHQLKWKRRGDVYWCTTAGLKGPIATLELAKDKKPIRLTGCTSSYSDYLIVTAILLLTDLQEWMLVSEEKTIAVPESLEGGVNSVEAMTSQWRKIMYRRANIPKTSWRLLLSPLNIRLSFISIDPQYITSAARLPWLVFLPVQACKPEKNPCFHSPDSEGEDEDKPLEDAVVATRPGSMAYPPSISHPPSHSYFDPTFYPQDLPPVPPLPLQYARSNLSLREAAGTSSTLSSPVSQSIRELPRPPSSSSQSRASPLSEPLSRVFITGIDTTHDHPFATQSHSTPASTSSSPVVGRTRSMTTGGHRSRSSRPLPTVPAQQHATGNHLQHQHTKSNGSFQSMHTVRRARSHATLAEEDSGFMTSDLSQSQEETLPVPVVPFASSANPASPTMSGRSLRSLPPTPISMDPTSPRPEVIQEELKVAAATVHLLRQQQQQEQQQYHHHHQHSQQHYTAHHQTSHHTAPTIRIPTSPLRKASITGAGTDDEDEDDGQAHESQASYERDKAAAMENASPQ
ncbi:hypothetical protein FA13DRAFT_1821229 [Coprinellus micaceus]|uniref:Uncharacterized protein n=1 Tax=Coprinellus micaceus TaxID=71717 RepID=A0A4Y7SCP8_COPMI|nr:hypothetical protein FA13DRAFT_1821229 [Coprinellus micaceus]